MGLLQDNEQQSYGPYGLLDEPGNRSGSGMLRYLSDADLLSLAGFMKPTKNGNFGEALMNGLAGAVEGRESQFKRQHSGLDALSKMRKEQEEYGLNPVIDNQGNAWVMSKSGIPKKITDFVPSDKISTINAGGNHYVVGRDGTLRYTYGSTQTPDNIASTGVNVETNGSVSGAPGYASAKGNIAEQTQLGEGRGRLPYDQQKSQIDVTEAASKKEAEERIARNSKIQNTLDSISKTRSILESPYSVGEEQLTAEDMLSKAADTLPGRGRDIALNAFGRQSYQDQLNTSLKRISDELLLSVPRFEGPQSDRDVQTYRSLAGNLGDPLVPAEKRLQTLKTIKDLLSINEQAVNSQRQQTPGLYGRSGNVTANFGSLDDALKMLDSPEIGESEKSELRKMLAARMGLQTPTLTPAANPSPFKSIGPREGDKRPVKDPNGNQATAIYRNGRWEIEQ